MLIAVLTLALNVYLDTDYFLHMPRTPEPSSGRVYAAYAMHSRLFVTAHEERRLRIAGELIPVSGAAGVIGLVLLNRGRQRPTEK